MMTIPKINFILVFFIFLLLVISFLRESVFENINAHSWYLYYENDASHLPAFLSFFKRFSYAELYRIKWVLTAMFSLLFLFLSSAIIKIIFRKKKFIVWTFYTYAAIVIVSAISFLLGKLLNHAESGYHISRFFMGLLQSPFLLIFLIPAFKLVTAEGEEKTA